MPQDPARPKPRITFAGGGEFGLPTLRRLLEMGYPIVQVITQPDRPAGRGRKLTPTPIAQFAQAHNLPLLRTADLNQEPPEHLPASDLLLVIAFGQKIAPSVIRRYPLGGINLHASRLPKYRGAAPINWAILNGETVTGNTVIRLADRMDAGAVLGQSRLEIGPLETAGELHDRLADDGAALLPPILDALAGGEAAEIPQDESLATRAPKLHRGDAHLDWILPAEVVARRIRGLSPWPGCHVHLQAQGLERPLRLTLLRAKPVPHARTERSPGQIDSHGYVQAGTGAVEVMEVQPEGKRPMSMDAYRNGHPWPAGGRLESI